MNVKELKTVITVLLIEDDPMVQEVNRQFIERVEGFRVVGAAGNGLDGLRLAGELRPDLVFLDVYMPSQDGLETLRKLRAEALPVDVIVVTAAKDAPTIQQMVRRGVRDYIIKPFKFERVRDALEQYRAHREALAAEGALTQAELDAILHGTAGGDPGSVEPAPPGSGAELPGGTGAGTGGGDHGASRLPGDAAFRSGPYAAAGSGASAAGQAAYPGHAAGPAAGGAPAYPAGGIGIGTGADGAAWSGRFEEGLPDLGELPKGLNPATMRQIMLFMRQQARALSAEEVADGIGIARVTARRYLDYLEKSRRVRLEVSYGGIGRPINRYALL